MTQENENLADLCLRKVFYLSVTILKCYNDHDDGSSNTGICIF